MPVDRRQALLALFVLFSTVPSQLRAQPAEDSPATADPAQHEHMQMTMPGDNTWKFMQDGILFAEFNHQGGPRGGNELVAPNWWMGMASRNTTHGQFTFTGMLSLDPATVGRNGYRELFQAGEALDG